jgi:serine/threonine protein phosphatase PrpC
MRCSRCDANLRESARFCNQCGARVVNDLPQGSIDDQPSSGLRPSGMALSDVAPSDFDVTPSDMRLRRRTRVLRRQDDPNYGAPAPVSRPLPRETSVLNGGDPLNLYPDVRNALSDTPTEETPAAQDAISDLPTAEYAATPISMSLPPNVLHGAAPWPLPAGVTLLDRFQVVAIVDAQPDREGASNTYRVVDLMGYARCWSCHTEHGSATAGERFCPTCGADMLGHEYLMIERRVIPGDDTQPRLAATGGAFIDSFVQQDRSYVISAIELENPRFPYGPHLSVAGMSHVGLTRAGDINEDSFATLTLNLAHDSRQQPLALAIVADGLGGHASGQEASRLAARIFIERLTKDLIVPFIAPMGGSLPPDEAVEPALRDAVNAANAAIYEANVQGAADMGSTLVAAIIAGDQAWIANVGDSRAYVFDGEALRRVTSDHSLVEQLIVSGMITPEERYTHIQRNRIFRSLGGDPTIEVDIFTQKLTPGMRLLLCSDGLWEMTRDPEMERILRETPDARAACEALIASANANGGEDNITAIVLRADA